MTEHAGTSRSMQRARHRARMRTAALALVSVALAAAAVADRRARVESLVTRDTGGAGPH